MEKMNYRDTLSWLAEQYPMLISRQELGKLLGVSQPTVRKIIQKNHWKCERGKIPLGAVASYICG